MRHAATDIGDRRGGASARPGFRLGRRRVLAAAAFVLLAGVLSSGAGAANALAGPADTAGVAERPAAKLAPGAHDRAAIPQARASAADPAPVAAGLAWLDAAAGSISTGPMAQQAAMAVAFGSAMALATLLACFGACAAFQRRLTRQVEATLTGMEMVNADMQDAANAARESASALSRLAGAVLGAEDPMRGWAQSAMAGQENARALAQRCAELTGALPALLPRLIGEALAAGQASSLDALEQAAARLDRHATAISAAADAVRHGGQAIATAAYSQANQLHVAAALARQCEAAIARVPDAVTAAVAAVQTGGLAALDAAAERLTGGSGRIEDAADTLLSAFRDAAALTHGHVALHESAARLVERCDAAAQGLPDAIGQAVDAVERRGTDHAHRLSDRLQDSALCLEAAAAELHGGLLASSEAQAAHAAALERALRQAGGFVSLLPEITASLAGGTAAIRREAQRSAQSLAEAAAKLARAALPADAAVKETQAGAGARGDAALAQDGAARGIEPGLSTPAGTAPPILPTHPAGRPDGAGAAVGDADRPPARYAASGVPASAPLPALEFPSRARAPLARIDDLLAQTASFLSEAAALAPSEGAAFAVHGATGAPSVAAGAIDAGTRRPPGAAATLVPAQQADQAAA
jgi:hypothetical protein